MVGYYNNRDRIYFSIRGITFLFDLQSVEAFEGFQVYIGCR